MDTIKFNSKEDFKKFIIAEAKKIVNQGDPVTDIEMNQMDRVDNSEGAAYVKAKEKGGFEKKTSAPENTPKEFEKTKDPIDVKQEDGDIGSDKDWATAAAVEGGKSKKTGVNDHAQGLANPDVTSKKDQPKTTEDNDPTKSGGTPGDKENTTEMNKEDKEDIQGKTSETTTKTQVLGDGTIEKDGFSKGQTDGEVNVKAKNENDPQEEKLRKSIETIQLPESFQNKKALDDYIIAEAKKLAESLD